jgi:hypothetical protein
MATIKFNADYETITKGKEYPVHKRYLLDTFDYLCFNDDIGEEIVLKQTKDAPPSEMFEVVE